MIPETAMMGHVQKHITGSFSVGERKFFYKAFGSKSDYDRELGGYGAIRKYYPVPRLVLSDLVGGYHTLVFDYERSISDNKGLLADSFAGDGLSTAEMDRILNVYRRAFLGTLREDRGIASRVFFKDRLSSRIPKFYKNSFVKRRFRFKLNGREIKISLEPILQEVRSFFYSTHKLWCVVSQCDPNDLNIAMKPVFFDFTGGGRIPLMAEFATFFWYQLIQSNYLNPRYNPAAFKGHERVYGDLDRVTGLANIRHAPHPGRVDFLERYIERVIMPCMDRLQGYDWYRDFKNFLAMRILGVFNISGMPEKDMRLSLGYLDLFYHAKIDNPRDLVALIK